MKHFLVFFFLSFAYVYGQNVFIGSDSQEFLKIKSGTEFYIQGLVLNPSSDFKLIDNISGKISITGSKSESNRLLILQAQYSNLRIRNISNSEDTYKITNALKSSKNLIDVHHAGTAMRFLSAYFSFKPESEVSLTGSKRMLERPIKILVNALKDLGASIKYQKINGFPPIKIKGILPSGNIVKLSSSTSSQYISALMLVAPKLPNGLIIELSGKTASRPYITMTESLLKKIGIKKALDKAKKGAATTNINKQTNAIIPPSIKEVDSLNAQKIIDSPELAGKWKADNQLNQKQKQI